MEDNFDKIILYYCKVSCSFIVGNMSPWKKKGPKMHPIKKVPAMVSIYQYQFRLQAVDVVGIRWIDFHIFCYVAVQAYPNG